MTGLFVLHILFACLLFGPVATNGTNCGKMYPARFMQHGTTAQRTLSYGSPVAVYTVGEPFIVGCSPSVAYVSTGQKIAQIDISYAEGSPLIPLVTAAVSNDSDVGSYHIEYERTQAGSPLPLRISNMTIVGSTDGGSSAKSFAIFSYDARGRLSMINWTYTGNSSARFGKQHIPKSVLSPLKRLHGVVPQAPTHGYELFSYEDEDHPDFVSVYSSNAFPDPGDGPDSARYKWATNKQGLVTDTTLLTYEPAACPAWPCQAGSSCCKNVGNDSNLTGTCFAVPSCDKLGGATWHYEYTSDGRAISMNASGTLQEYEYDNAGRLVSFHQGNTTFMLGSYDKESDSVTSLTYFVIYPLFPEVFGFGPPALSFIEQGIVI